MILETDMSKHFHSLGIFTSRALSTIENFSLQNSDDKMIVLKTAIKAADIGHSCKDWDLHYNWSMKVVEEFFKQGDIERNN